MQDFRKTCGRSSRNIKESLKFNRENMREKEFIVLSARVRQPKADLRINSTPSGLQNIAATGLLQVATFFSFSWQRLRTFGITRVFPLRAYKPWYSSFNSFSRELYELALMRIPQESPHQQEQSLLLTRIITNVVSYSQSVRPS